MLLVFKRYPLQ